MKTNIKLKIILHKFSFNWHVLKHTTSIHSELGSNSLNLNYIFKYIIQKTLISLKSIYFYKTKKFIKINVLKKQH